jgi:hypothetical protein
LVKFGYRETNPRRAARLWWQKLKDRFTREQRQPASRSLWGDLTGARISARQIFAGSVVLIICLMSFLGYLRLRSRPTNGPAQTSGVQTTAPRQNTSLPDRPGGQPTIAPGTDAPVAQVNKNNNRPEQTATPVPRSEDERSIAAKLPAVPPSSRNADAPAQTGDEEVAGEVTRSGSVVGNLNLSEVKKVYVEIRGGAAFSELRRNFVESLGSSGVVAATTNADDADAALKIVVSQTSTGDIRGLPRIEASALLVNARGAVLWPKANRAASRYSGETSKVVADITKDLVSEIRLARAGH